jgi:hypothetical protein
MVTNQLLTIETESNFAIEKFLGFELSAEDFCVKIIFLWRSYRDAEEHSKQAEYEQQESESMKALLQNELTSEKSKNISSKSIIKKSFFKMLTMIHGSCSAFTDSPENEWEIDEQQLRFEVQAFFTEYQNIKAQPAELSSVPVSQ